MFKRRLPGYFELLDAIVDDLEMRQYVPYVLRSDIPPGYLLDRASLPDKSQAINNVVPVLHSLLAEQITEDDQKTMGANEFGIAPVIYEDKGCVFLCWPFDKKDIDFGRLRQSVEDAQSLMKEASPSMSFTMAGGFVNPIVLGPIDEKKFKMHRHC